MVASNCGWKIQWKLPDLQYGLPKIIIIFFFVWLDMEKWAKFCLPKIDFYQTTNKFMQISGGKMLGLYVKSSYASSFKYGNYNTKI